MSPFLPNTFWPALYAVVLAFVIATAILHAPRLWPIVSIMGASWILSRTVSAYDMPGLWQAAADIACAAALIAIRRPTIVVLPVAFLFLIMIFAYAAHDAGILSRDTMWAWADVSGYLQLLIILSASFHGGRRFGLGLGFDCRTGYPDNGLTVPVRVSCEAISSGGSGGGSNDIGGGSANSRSINLSSLELGKRHD